ncbi:hypothetical protein C8R45DRAFT_1220645 [Mycena sanguinolenta]|nr:hypothetical protein C8R45DRAFT_1220645 [Mycena sanguinolenta]
MLLHLPCVQFLRHRPLQPVSVSVALVSLSLARTEGFHWDGRRLRLRGNLELEPAPRIACRRMTVFVPCYGSYFFSLETWNAYLLNR